MTDLNFLQGIKKIEILIGKTYRAEQLEVMKEVLSDIPDREWECVMRDTLRDCGRELPTVAEIRKNRWKQW